MAHSVFAKISRAGTGKTGIARISAQNLRTSLGLRAEQLEEAVGELARACLLVKSEFDDWDRLVLTGPRCGCVAPRVGGGGRKSKSLELQAVAEGTLREPSVPSVSPRRPRASGRRAKDKSSDVTRGGRYSSYGLAWHLHEEVVSRYFGQYPGAVDLKATARHISTWIRVDGVDPTVIETMINTFVASPANFRKGIPIWKSFIARRQQWLAAAQRISAQREDRLHATDRDYWLSTPERRFDPSEWAMPERKS